eukprot:403331989
MSESVVSSNANTQYYQNSKVNLITDQNNNGGSSNNSSRSKRKLSQNSKQNNNSGSKQRNSLINSNKQTNNITKNINGFVNQLNGNRQIQDQFQSRNINRNSTVNASRNSRNKTNNLSVTYHSSRQNDQDKAKDNSLSNSKIKRDASVTSASKPYQIRHQSQNRNDGDKDGEPECIFFGAQDHDQEDDINDNINSLHSNEIDQLLLISQNSDTLMSTQKQLDFLNITTNMNTHKYKKPQNKNSGQFKQKQSVNNNMQLLQMPSIKNINFHAKQSKSSGLSVRNDKIIGSGNGQLVQSAQNSQREQQQYQIFKDKSSSSTATNTVGTTSLINNNQFQSGYVKLEPQNKKERITNSKIGFHKPEIIKLNQQPNRLSVINSNFLSSDIMNASDTQMFNSSFGQEPSVRKVYKREQGTLTAAKLEMQIHQTLIQDQQNHKKEESELEELEEEVKMINQELWCVPDRFIELSMDNHTIKSLDLQGNQIRRFFQKFLDCLPNIETLNLSKNQLQTFNVKSHCKLRILNLSYNQLDNLGDEVGNIQSLQEINISHNQFKRLTTSVISLKKLEILDISFNKLRDLPNGLGYLTKLSQLYLQNNKLKYLPSEFHYLKNLTKIGIDWLQYCYPPLPVIFEKQQKRFEEFNSNFCKLSQQKEQNELSRDQNITFHEFTKALSSSESYIQYMDNKNRSKLHLAVLKNDKTILNYLLENETDSDCLNDLDTDHYSPLGLALKEEKIKLVHRLLKEINIKIDIRCGQFNSALMLAIQKLDPSIVEKMLEKGSDVNLKDINSGDYPIHMLMSVFNKNITNSRRILELMIQYACDLNLKNSDQWTALHLAVKKNSYEAVQALIETSYQGLELDGVDLNNQGGTDRLTPLHLAASGSYITNYKIVNILIENGADLFIQNIYQKTPFNCVSNNLLMLKLLKKAQVKRTKLIFSTSENLSQVKEQHFQNSEIMSKVFHNSKKNIKPKQLHSVNQTLNQKTLENYEIPSETQVKEAEQKMISFQHQLNAIAKYLQDPTKKQLFKNFQGQQIVSSAKMFKVDFRRNVSIDGINNKLLSDSVIAEEENSPQTLKSPKIKNLTNNFNSPDLSLTKKNSLKNSKNKRSSGKRPLSPEEPNFQIKTMKTPNRLRKKDRSGNRFSKTTQDFNQLLNTNFSSNQTSNIYFLKDELTDYQQFNLKSSQEQIQIVAKFQQLFLSSNEKQYNLVVDIIETLDQITNDYITEIILEFIENLQISLQIEAKYRFRDRLELLQQKLQTPKPLISSKIEDLLDQFPNIYNLNVNNHENQRFTMSRLSNTGVNIDLKFNSDEHNINNLHRDKNPFVKKYSEQCTKKNSSKKIIDARDIHKNSVGQKNGLMAVRQNGAGSRDKAISFTGIYQNQNLMIPSKKQLHHPAITFNLPNKKNTNNTLSVNAQIQESFKNKYVVFSPPSIGKQQSNVKVLQIDAELDKTQNIFNFNQSIQTSTSAQKPPLSSNLVFLSPHATSGFKNYFQEQKEEGSTPKQKQINTQTTRIKHDINFNNGTTNKVTVSNDAQRTNIRDKMTLKTSLGITQDKHASKMLNYHNHKSDGKPQNNLDPLIVDQDKLSQEQSRQNSAYKVQKVALQELFEGQELIEEFPEDLCSADLNFQINKLQSNDKKNSTQKKINSSKLSIGLGSDCNENQKVSRIKNNRAQDKVSDRMSDQWKIYSLRKVIDSPKAPNSSSKKPQQQGKTGTIDMNNKPKISQNFGFQQTRKKS